MNQNIINEILLVLLRENSHGREISKALNIPLTTVQRSLLNLKKNNVVDYNISGKNKVYFIKKNITSKRYVYNAENYNLVKIIKHYPHLEPIMEKILEKCKSQLIILFGSYAKLNAKEGSDIDIYIETTNNNLKKEIESIDSRLSVKTGNFDIKSLLIKEIIKNHVIIKGVEGYYEKIKFF